jgi:hypothetical protein
LRSQLIAIECSLDFSGNATEVMMIAMAEAVLIAQLFLMPIVIVML